MPERRDQLDWAEAYYEALESFCWEPQHIGRKKHPSVKFNYFIGGIGTCEAEMH